MTEMQKLLEDYANDNRYILRQMYKWLTPKEFNTSRLNKRKRKVTNDKLKSKHG